MNVVGICLLVVVALLALSSPSRAQEEGTQVIAQAHEAAAEQTTAAEAPTAPANAASSNATSTAPAGRHTYDMPARDDDYAATARVPASRETERIGDYAQPRWTAFRRFPTTRVYVRPAGTMAFEWWLETKLNLDDTREVRHRSQYEFEFGLGGRVQLDVYMMTEQLGHQGPMRLAAEKVELRYALADWGDIPLNPTLYAEFVRQDEGPPKVEAKALFGEQLGTRVFVASNLVFEHELGDAQENEYAVTFAGAYSLADSHVSLGAEVKLETVDRAGARLTFDNYEVLVGPSLFVSPIDPMRILFVALFGVEVEGNTRVPLFEPTLIVGWEI